VFIIRGHKPASFALPLALLVDWRPSSTSTSSRRPLLELLAGASHLPADKWFVPGSWLQVTCFSDSPSVEKTKGPDCVFLFLSWVFFVNFQASFADLVFSEVCL
jgi:hypothetical protein